jgi:hypothetical protein
VLSTADFKLIQETLLFYLKAHENEPDTAKYANLYHRLGSATRAEVTDTPGEE